MKVKINKEITSLFGRYLLIVLAAVSNLWIFYKIFTPLTVYPVYWITQLFFQANLLAGQLILINGEIEIWLVEACIAGAAYYLLFALNLSVPKVKIKKRIKMVLFSFFSLLFVNILRIILMIFVYIYGQSFFDAAHIIFWYGISIIFVVAVWFLEVKLFKIKEIPFYSDLKNLYLVSARKPNPLRNKKSAKNKK